ncbi:MAG: hypothetical protein ABT00_15445 [Bordetella sp. SCN 68-11]|nr:MAG: hypothetical protein ABT00_15445 [Bordetella sp. SCN 68-11]
MKDYRIAQWRKWAAKELMAQPERNRRVMIALARSGHTGDVKTIEFGQVAKRIAGPWVVERLDFAAILHGSTPIDPAQPVIVPGEIELGRLARSRAEGVELDADTAALLAAYAAPR